MASRGGSALERLTSREVAGDLLVVPLGATEQHGPHLPLGTDTVIASALASSLPGAVVAPALRSERVRAVSPNGVLGDPSGASAEEGRALLAAAIEDLAAFVDDRS